MTNVTSQLTLAVDSTQVKAADSALDSFAQSGKKAETAAAALEKTTKGSSTALAEAARQAKEAERALRDKERAEKKAAAAAEQARKKQERETARALADAERLAQRQRNIGAQQSAQLGFQLQDFFVQVQAGQNPLTAFIQQGSQLSGVYGSAGSAFKAVTGLLTPLRLAFGGVAATIGIAALAASQAKDEQNAFAAAIVGTGGAVGKTRGQLQDYARQIASTVGTTGAAADAIAQLAATGQVTGSTLLEAGTVAVRAQRLIGREVGDTVKAYAALGKDPVQALLALNDGTNFLTAAVFRQVLAYKSLGNDTAAAALAQKAYSEGQKRVLDDAEKNLGTLERGLIAAKDAAKGFWDAIVGIGRPQTLAQQLEAANKALQTGPRRGTNAVQGAQRREGIGESRDNLTRAFLAQDNAQASAAAALKDQQDKLEELGAARQAARAAVKRADQSKDLALLLAGYEQQRAATVLAFQRDEVESAQHQKRLLEIDEATIQAQIDNIDRLAAIEAARNTSSLDDALQKQAALKSLEAQRIQQQQRLAQLQADEARGLRDIAPKSRTLGGRDGLLAFKAQDEANVSEFLKQQRESITATDLALKQAREAAQQYLDTFTLAQQRELAGAGQGQEARARTQARQQIEDRYEQQRQQIESQRRAGQITKERYDAELQTIAEFKEKALASFEDYYAKRQQLDQDASIGIRESLADYISNASKTAKQTKDAFTNSLKGVEDAFVELATTGKLNFKSLANSIIAEFARIQAQKAIAGLLSIFGGGGGSTSFNSTGGGDIIKTPEGRAIGGPVSSGSMYRVLEKGQPEVLTSGGKSYLMTGSQGGQVTPVSAGESAPVVNINVAGDVTPKTAQLVATLVSQALIRERRNRAFAGA